MKGDKVNKPEHFSDVASFILRDIDIVGDRVKELYADQQRYRDSVDLKRLEPEDNLPYQQGLDWLVGSIGGRLRCLRINMQTLATNQRAITDLVAATLEKKQKMLKPKEFNEWDEVL